MQVLGGAEVEREDGAGGVVDGAEEEQGRAGPEPVEWAAVDEDEGAQGRGGAGAARRCCGGRRRRFGGSPRARRRRRTVSRPTGRPSTSRSFSVQWQSLKSRYVVWISSTTRIRISTSSARGAGPARRRWTRPRTPAVRYRASRRRNCRGVMSRAWAPAPVVICPATASCTKPGRRASLRLIVRISHVSMGGHFYRAVRGGHFYSAARGAIRPLDSGNIAVYPMV